MLVSDQYWRTAPSSTLGLEQQAGRVKFGSTYSQVAHTF